MLPYHVSAWRPARPLGPQLAVAAFALLSAWGGIELTREAGRVASIWLANGALTAVLLRSRTDRWPGFLAAGLMANVAANLLAGDGLALALALPLCNSIEVLVAASGVRSVCGVKVDLSRGRQLAWFVLFAVMLAPTIGGLGASLALHVINDTSYWAVWRIWLLSDGLGMIVMAPPVLMLRPGKLRRSLRPYAVLETIAILSLVAGISIAVFREDYYSLMFLILPCLLIAAFRLGYGGMAAALLTSALVVIVLTINGYGPIAHLTPVMADRVLYLQFFLAVSALTALPVATALAERQRLLGDLQSASRKLHVLATTDELTGLANRREFMSLLNHEARRAAEEHRPLCLAILDVDHFKQVNDCFGHAAGDAVLRTVARICRANVRAHDHIGRLGGEEFGILLPETEIAEAEGVCERLRLAMEAADLSGIAVGLRVTLSVGAAELDADESVTDLMQRADRALYVAKQSGRNRLELAS